MLYRTRDSLILKKFAGFGQLCLLLFALVVPTCESYNSPFNSNTDLRSAHISHHISLVSHRGQRKQNNKPQTCRPTINRSSHLLETQHLLLVWFCFHINEVISWGWCIEALSWAVYTVHHLGQMFIWMHWQVLITHKLKTFETRALCWLCTFAVDYSYYWARLC